MAYCDYSLDQGFLWLSATSSWLNKKEHLKKLVFVSKAPKHQNTSELFLTKKCKNIKQRF